MATKSNGESMSTEALQNSLSFWNYVNLGALIFAALAGAVTIAAGVMVNRRSNELQDVKDLALAKLQRESTERIAGLDAKAKAAELGIAEANARTAAAQLKVAVLNSPRSVVVTKERREAWIAALTPFAGQQYMVSAGDAEGVDFIMHLKWVLDKAGWKRVIPTHNTQLIRNDVGDPIALVKDVIGVSIRYSTGAGEEDRQRARFLASLLTETGVTAWAEQKEPPVMGGNSCSTLRSAKNIGPWISKRPCRRVRGSGSDCPWHRAGVYSSLLNLGEAIAGYTS